MTKIKKKMWNTFQVIHPISMDGPIGFIGCLASYKQMGLFHKNSFKKLPEPSPTLPALKHKNPFIQLNQMQLVGTSCVVAQLKNKYPDVPMMF